jgi:hypothetical protein
LKVFTVTFVNFRVEAIAWPCWFCRPDVEPHPASDNNVVAATKEINEARKTFSNGEVFIGI